MEYTYTQPQKNEVRHRCLSYAIDLLTTNRNKACCVDRKYVRDIYDYFLLQEETTEKKEADKIDIEYIKQWEKLHDSFVGIKRPEDLCVCYLAGSEPNNDFKELTDMGVLPHNIWAFENDKTIFETAISSYEQGVFPQPKIVREKIENFFKYTPKKFDIVYIDACGSVPSQKHSLKIVSLLCQYHRLNSPGIIITNFSSPDISKPNILDAYALLVAQYLYFKEYSNKKIKIENSRIINEDFVAFLKKVRNEFVDYYGEFLSAVIRDIAAFVIPIQRFNCSSFIEQLAEKDEIKDLTISEINEIKNSSFTKYMSFVNHLNKKNTLDEKTKLLINELNIFNGDLFKMFNCFNMIYRIKNNQAKYRDEVKEIQKYFNDKNNIYQFLDKPDMNLFFDLYINQMSYPLHYNTDKIRRYSYVAKSNRMFTDVTVLDECRYVYEWQPSLCQLRSAFCNKSWQYIFRFAIDGLVKCRHHYNNETFFKGSVICNPMFKNKELLQREKIIF